MKLLDSDEEEDDQAAGDSAVTEREAIANELFEGGEDAGEVLNAEHVCWIMSHSLSIPGNKI